MTWDFDSVTVYDADSGARSFSIETPRDSWHGEMTPYLREDIWLAFVFGPRCDVYSSDGLWVIDFGERRALFDEPNVGVDVDLDRGLVAVLSRAPGHPFATVSV